jgi:hypothetical protein
MTAEEFLEKENLPESISGGTLNYAMIEFAKIHVTAALQAAEEIAIEFDSEGNYDNSILNAYPLDLIK